MDVVMHSNTLCKSFLKQCFVYHNVKFLLQETLTGFKWMGNLACDLMAQGKTVLFSFEEAIGEE